MTGRVTLDPDISDPDLRWEAAFDALPRGGVVWVEPGRWEYWSRARVTPPSDVRIQGAGRGATRLVRPAGAEHGLYFYALRNVVLADLMLDGGVTDETPQLEAQSAEVTFEGGQNCGLERVDIARYNADAAILAGYDTYATNCRAVGQYAATFDPTEGPNATGRLGSRYGWLCPGTMVTHGLRLTNTAAFGHRSAGYCVGGVDLQAFGSRAFDNHLEYLPCNPDATPPVATGGGQFAISRTWDGVTRNDDGWPMPGTQPALNVVIGGLHIRPSPQAKAVTGLELADCDGVVATGLDIQGSPNGGGVAIDRCGRVSLVGGSVRNAGAEGIRVTDSYFVTLAVQVMSNAVGVRVTGTSGYINLHGAMIVGNATDLVNEGPGRLT